MNTQSATHLGLEFNDRLSSPSTPDFRGLLGEAAWKRLPAAVQDRFCASAHVHGVTHYRGSMKVRASFLGRALAQVCRLIGTPVAPWVGDDVTMQVRVYESDAGIVWERRYEFANRSPVTVLSTKQLDCEGGLVESLGAGLRMRLCIYEEHGQLHFVSTGYYFEAAGLRLALPNWFLPGVTHVIHEDLGAGNFRFSMSTDHGWLGQLYFQDGVFH
ncbi:MAG: DUF4166 domain-containing protein [Povalibacter sp.]